MCTREQLYAVSMADIELAQYYTQIVNIESH